MSRPRVGFLPLYLALYDEVRGEKRPAMEAFYSELASRLEGRGIEVLRSPVCRLEAEVSAAVDSYRDRGAEAIVTVHLAYSPSLESAGVLASTDLPLIVLDTTPSRGFGPDQDPDQIMYNHGIHGVQDLCNLLLRHGRDFYIEAGHWESSDVLDRVARLCRSAHLAARMRRGRVGLIGEPFRGMGDFSIDLTRLEELTGVETVRLKGLDALLSGVSEEEIERERKADSRFYDHGEMSDEAYRNSLRLFLALKSWVEKAGLSAWTFNFLHITRDAGFETVPFLGASKLMARGIGYAGEGDVLTASLVGAVAALYPDTSFTEMFCPDWQRGAVFVSHMGEMNPRLTAGKPELVEKEYTFSDTGQPVIGAGRFREGNILLIDLAPMAGERFRLILAPAVMMDVSGDDRMAGLIRGWFKPPLALAEFLERYSRHGGTHHLALSYGAEITVLRSFGEMMGWEVVQV
jgi:L-arabinose isomerase